MNKNNTTRREKRARRRVKVRAKISGTADRPRLAVHRSLLNIFAQLIDDTTGKTLLSVHSKKNDTKADVGERKGKTAAAYLVGLELAKQAKDKKIVKVVFDRAGFQYHGRVKALADGAREGGLEF
ncbi:MAG: 50S ribosomal protein L18 [Candidatus Magasanikbacteria bacterium]|jgi:large subunit ribosomal protein L18|nr:50S ribosomal protein L18 [Candidatus Magasanikbacteria bacterium]MBT4314649.1 50S ribosomal protein L18 [Candidatus Magasanikbacteria bacterium]MBT4547069.1 50S ribosomal protein L18 [Candidatus Magasanikbacteria bacterium]MBT6819529.1 50S ribosomal protein L18 [Candidatus Magasanikbacteria bacterium]